MSAVNPQQTMTFKDPPKSLRETTNFQKTFSIDYDVVMKKPKSESKAKGNTVCFKKSCLNAFTKFRYKL